MCVCTIQPSTFVLVFNQVLPPHTHTHEHTEAGGSDVNPDHEPHVPKGGITAEMQVSHTSWCLYCIGIECPSVWCGVCVGG